MLRRIAALLRRIESTPSFRQPGPRRGGDSAAFEAKRRAVAAALARNSVEIDRCRRMRIRTSDLQKQFLAALAGADAEGARTTATELALLEKECADSETVQKVLHEEIDRLKRELSEMRGEIGGRMEAAA